jgi:hypothetical protein
MSSLHCVCKSGKVSLLVFLLAFLEGCHALLMPGVPLCPFTSQGGALPLKKPFSLISLPFWNPGRNTNFTVALESVYEVLISWVFGSGELYAVYVEGYTTLFKNYFSVSGNWRHNWLCLCTFHFACTLMWTLSWFQEAQAYAEENSLLFMETSAKTAMNVNDLFLAIGKLHDKFRILVV